MTLLLILHIFVAVIATAGVAGLMIAGALFKSARTVRVTAWTSLAATCLSGCGLLLIGASWSSFCAPMLVLTAAMLGADMYYRRRLARADATA